MARRRKHTTGGADLQADGLRWTVERVAPTGQQLERIEDGLRLVMELVARRYRADRASRNSAPDMPESPG